MRQVFRHLGRLAEDKPINGQYGYDVYFEIEKGKDLIEADWYGKSDPYVDVTVVTPNGPKFKYRTRTVWRTLDPVFREFFWLRNVGQGTVFKLSVWDKDTISADDPMGTAEWTFHPLQQDQLDVQHRQQKQQWPQDPQWRSWRGPTAQVPLDVTHPTKRGAAAGKLYLRVGYQLSEKRGVPRMMGPVRFRQNLCRVTGAMLGKWGPEQMTHSTVKLFLHDVDLYFSGFPPCPWNRNHPAAVSIFTNPLAMAMVKTQHASLYAQGSGLQHELMHQLSAGISSGGGSGGAGGDGASGVSTGASAPSRDGLLQCGDDLMALLLGSTPERDGTRPQLTPSSRHYFTYVLMKDSFRFTQTGAAFLDDMVSKHAMHSGAATEVVYAGEFVVVTERELQLAMERSGGGSAPAGQGDGWEGLPIGRHDSVASAPALEPEPETLVLVIDNNSGTYAPPANRLWAMADLLMDNFPGLLVETVDSQSQSQLLKRLHAYCPSRSQQPAMALWGSRSAGA